jgi:hypothetical protein
MLKKLYKNAEFRPILSDFEGFLVSKQWKKTRIFALKTHSNAWFFFLKKKTLHSCVFKNIYKKAEKKKKKKKTEKAVNRPIPVHFRPFFRHQPPPRPVLYLKNPQKSIHSYIKTPEKGGHALVAERDIGAGGERQRAAGLGRAHDAVDGVAMGFGVLLSDFLVFLSAFLAFLGAFLAFLGVFLSYFEWFWV